MWVRAVHSNTLCFYTLVVHLLIGRIVYPFHHRYKYRVLNQVESVFHFHYIGCTVQMRHLPKAINPIHHGFCYTVSVLLLLGPFYFSNRSITLSNRVWTMRKFVLILNAQTIMMNDSPKIATRIASSILSLPICSIPPTFNPSDGVRASNSTVLII